MIKYLLTGLGVLYACINPVSAQNIRFSYVVESTGATTTDVKIYAETTSGTENMAGYTVYFYYNNVEANVTGFDSSPTTTGLGWAANNETSITHQAENNASVPITHTGYFFYQNIDNSVAGDDFTTTPIHLMTIHFDYSNGSAEAGFGFLAGTNEVPPMEYVNSDFEGFDVIITGAQTQGLPVELLSFRAIPDGKHVVLQWSTATEVNSDYFEVQHSTDGVHFEKIGIKKAAGNTTFLQQYDLPHFRPAKGINYYRLKQVDLDGKFEYSGIVSVEMGSSSDFANVRIYPNPAVYEVFVEMPSESDFQVQLFNAAGQLMLSENNSSKLDISHLQAGTYLLRISDKSQKPVLTQPIIIQK